MYTIIPTWSLKTLNYETSELNICPKEAQLSHIGAQYSSEETAQTLPNEAKGTFTLMEYRQRLFVYNARRQIIMLSTIEIRVYLHLNPHNLSSDRRRLEAKYDSCEK